MSKEAEILKRAREALQQLQSMNEEDRQTLLADGTAQSLLDLIERLTPVTTEPGPTPPSTAPGFRRPRPRSRPTPSS